MDYLQQPRFNGVNNDALARIAANNRRIDELKKELAMLKADSQDYELAANRARAKDFGNATFHLNRPSYRWQQQRNEEENLAVKKEEMLRDYEKALNKMQYVENDQQEKAVQAEINYYASKLDKMGVDYPKYVAGEKKSETPRLSGEFKAQADNLFVVSNDGTERVKDKTEALKFVEGVKAVNGYESNKELQDIVRRVEKAVALDEDKYTEENRKKYIAENYSNGWKTPEARDYYNKSYSQMKNPSAEAIAEHERISKAKTYGEIEEANRRLFKALDGAIKAQDYEDAYDDLNDKKVEVFVGSPSFSKSYILDVVRDGNDIVYKYNGKFVKRVKKR